jgi:hypothetical protein
MLKCMEYIQGLAVISDDLVTRNRWRGKSVLVRRSSETQSISVAMERWSVKNRVFAVDSIFKNDSVVTQRIFRRHFNIHRNECP